MAKDVTAKDVLYALQYMGDELIRTPIRDGKAEWRIKSTRAAVKERVADEVRSNPNVISIQDLARQVVRWRA